MIGLGGGAAATEEAIEDAAAADAEEAAGNAGTVLWGALKVNDSGSRVVQGTARDDWRITSLMLRPSAAVSSSEMVSKFMSLTMAATGAPEPISSCDRVYIHVHRFIKLS